MVLVKSNCIILRHYLSNKYGKTQNNCIWKNLFNISIEPNIVDPDQTAPTGAVWSGSRMFVYETSNILVDDKKHTFCDYAL